MPILTVEWVGPPPPAGLAQRLADAAGEALGTPPGRTWVRLHHLPAERYAEQGTPAPEAPPVFAELLARAAPTAAQVTALTHALAAACGRPAHRVHVLVLPPAVGRMHFGGESV